MKLPDMKVYANKVKEYWPRSLMYQHDCNNICYFKFKFKFNMLVKTECVLCVCRGSMIMWTILRNGTYYKDM